MSGMPQSDQVTGRSRMARCSWMCAVVAALWCMATGYARAQGSCTFTDENGKTVTWPNCQPPTATPGSSSPTPATAPASKPNAPAPTNSPATSAPKSFPFPGETQEQTPTPSSAVTPPQSPNNGQTNAPQSSTPAPANAPAGSRFPFPGEQDNPASSSSSSSPLGDAGSSGSGSSSSSSSDEDPFGDSNSGLPAGDDDPAAKAAAKRRAEKRRLAGSKPQTQDEREAEDLQVGSFYMDGENYRGAYLRAKDAVTYGSDDPEAHFLLAESARKLGKLDEALAEYRKCLTLDPIPKTKKAAEKAIKEMAGS